jgi:uncharacterized membrane protein
MVRGDIQDPFSPVWGSVGALANRLFRLEPDLNPAPWIDAPDVARFLGAALPSALVALGVISGRRALQQGRSLDSVSACVAFSLAASPFAASYHLVLLTLPATALAVRLRGPHLFAWLLGWIALGSPLMNVFRESATPLAYSRFLVLTGVAFLVARPYLRFFHLVPVVVLGLAGGLWASFPAVGGEAWPRIAEATGYSMFRPHYCGANLRWFVPSSDGRGLETRGAGEHCAASVRAPGEVEVTSRFANGSFNLYLNHSGLAGSTRITFSDANEVDPVFTPDGCAVVFASDQGRGLGSTALYRLDVSRLIPGCAGDEPALVPPGSRLPA